MFLSDLTKAHVANNDNGPRMHVRGILRCWNSPLLYYNRSRCFSFRDKRETLGEGQRWFLDFVAVALDIFPLVAWRLMEFASGPILSETRQSFKRACNSFQDEIGSVLAGQISTQDIVSHEKSKILNLPITRDIQFHLVGHTAVISPGNT